MAKHMPKLAEEARNNCEKWRTYFKRNIDQYHEFHDFVLGRQWSEDDERDMLKTYNKVPLQFNKLATLINTMLGEQQQNTPMLQVVPMDNCDEQTAEIREALTKDILFSTSAKNSFQVAAAQAFTGGFGCILLDTEYAYAKSFDLNICVSYLKDATRAYFDISAERINKTDGMYAGYFSRMSRTKFASIYGKDLANKIQSEKGNITASKAEIAQATDSKVGSDGFNWADEDAITINDYFKRVYEKETIYKLSNNKVVTQEELDEIIEKSKKIRQELVEEQQAEYEALLVQATELGTELPPPIIEDDRVTLYDDGQIVRIEDEKEVKKHKIMHYKFAGDYCLDETEFPCEQLPVVFVDQNSYYDKNGNQVCRAFVQDAKDAQKYINYLGTQSAYLLKISRYDQFIGSKRNVQSLDTQQVWQNPMGIQGMLTFDESPTGVVPQQLRPPELPSSLITQYQRAMEDLYTSTGLYPTRLGNTGNEVSGAAIDARTKQGSYSTYVAFNSINRAIGVVGEIINEMIPRVYDAERVIRIMTHTGEKVLTVNQQVDEYGEVIERDIRKGTYQVKLLPGPSFEGQKQEALESLNQVLKYNPQLFNMIADLYVESLPLANNIELKNRLRTLVPPQIIQAGKTGESLPPEPPQPDPAQILAEQQQQMLQQDLENKSKQLDLKAQEIMLKAKEQEDENQRELERIEMEKVKIAAQLEEQQLRYRAELDKTISKEAIAQANNLIKVATAGVKNGRRS